MSVRTQLIEDLGRQTAAADEAISRLEESLSAAKRADLSARTVSELLDRYARSRAEAFAKRLAERLDGIKSSAGHPERIPDLVLDMRTGDVDSDGLYWFFADAIRTKTEEVIADHFPKNGKTMTAYLADIARIESELSVARQKAAELRDCLRTARQNP